MLTFLEFRNREIMSRYFSWCFVSCFCLLITTCSAVATDWVMISDPHSRAELSWDKDSLVLNEEKQWAYLWVKLRHQHEKMSSDGGVLYKERLRYLVISCMTKEEAILQDIYLSGHEEERFRKSYDQAEFSLIKPGSDIMLVSQMACQRKKKDVSASTTNEAESPPVQSKNIQHTEPNSAENKPESPLVDSSIQKPKSLEELVHGSDQKESVSSLMSKALGDSFRDLFSDYVTRIRSWFLSSHDQKIEKLIDDTYKKSPWSYTGYTAPIYWHRLSDDYELCADTHNQSPIAIDHYLLSALINIDFHYRADMPSVSLDPKRSLIAHFKQGGLITLGSYSFSLKEIQFHRPAEHTILGKRYPMSLHILHEDKRGHLLIIAIPIDENPKSVSNSFLRVFLDNFPLNIEAFSYDMVGVKLTIDDLLPKNKQYFTYLGSLTTPPCTEGVLWIVFRSPLLISHEQLSVLEQIVPYNARPLQDIGPRLVKLSH